MSQIRQRGDTERPRHVLRPPPDPGGHQHQQDPADRAPGTRHLQVSGVFINLDGMDGINKQFVRALGGKIVPETGQFVLDIKVERTGLAIQT